MILNYAILRTTLDLIKPRSREFTERFFKNLFQHSPELEGLLDCRELYQLRRECFNAFCYVIENMHNAQDMEFFIEGLGEKIHELGLHSDHLDEIGDVLLNTFEHYFGPRWTPKLNDAWSQGWSYLAKSLKEAGPQIALPEIS